MTTNGGNELELPEHRAKQVEAGMAYHQSVLAQRDELAKKLSDALDTIAGLKIQLEALHGVHNMMESSIVSHRVDRDQAVARSAKLEAILENAMVVIHSGLKKSEPVS